MPSKGHNKALAVEKDMTNVHGSMCAVNDALREHRIVEYCKHEEHSRACIYDWVGIISELYDSGRGRHAKRVVALLRTEIFKLNGRQETLKNVPVCIRF